MEDFSICHLVYQDFTNDMKNWYLWLHAIVNFVAHLH